MKLKHKINDIVFLCNDTARPDNIEVRLVLGVKYIKHENEIYYTLDNGKEYKEGEVLDIEEVRLLNPQIKQPYQSKHKF
jgi:hypothetical protein